MLVKSLILVFLQFLLALITSYGGTTVQRITKAKPTPNIQVTAPCCTRDATLFSSALMFPLSDI